MIEIGANVTGGASEALRALISTLTGPELAELNSIGGRAAAQAAARYHHEFDAGGGWRNGKTGGRSRFGADVAAGWQFLIADQTGALILNDADHYGFKVRGGTIVPKRVQYLTIPLIPEAKGLRAETYVQNTGRKLFTIPGRSALFERVDRNTGIGERVITRTAGRNRDGSRETIRRRGGIRAVYALVRSVTQTPVPGALPPDDVVGEAFSEAWRNELADRIDRITS